MRTNSVQPRTCSTQPSLPTTCADIPTTDTAVVYERKYVNDVYDQIASHFAATRHTPWPRVNEFLQSLPNHSIVADIGCGNGKYLNISNKLDSRLFVIATDFCQSLVEYAQQRRSKEDNVFDVGVADALALPFKNNSFDAAINIAVVHHFATRERRVTALEETVRVLRPGGKALVYVWALERPSASHPKGENSGSKMLRRRFESQDVFVPWHMRTKKEGAVEDRILGDWHAVHRRYYHVYHKGELESEADQLANVNIIESYYDHQNWCLLIEKR